MRSELMASIYDKALKRKDFSGVTKKDEEEVASNDSKRKFIYFITICSPFTLW